MSSKSKSQKNIDKMKIPPRSPTTTHSTEQPTLSSEDAQRLETEICWCIQQLQTALKSGKLNAKQIKDHVKAMNTLMNNSVPLVKKRQVMRLSFGDYRAKMAAEEKRMSSVNTKIKVSPASASKHSMFIKKSLFTSSGNSFRFNFEEPVMNECEDKLNDEAEHCADKMLSPKFHFAQSDNSFKFNFTVD